ncbi:MAG TPA: hypothetical protein VJ440_08470, partial [Candidatus Brocadiaceae bacterium]|nr:hypothetical protein [Candidatus Brocadiaceae bacterium]
KLINEHPIWLIIIVVVIVVVSFPLVILIYRRISHGSYVKFLGFELGESRPKQKNSSSIQDLTTITSSNIYDPDTGVDKVYENEEGAAKDIIEYANLSETVRCISIRGNRFISDDRSLNELLKPPAKYREIRIMIADPDSDACKERSQGFSNSISHETTAEYQEDVKNVINKLERAKQRNNKIKLKLHCQPEAFRLIITNAYTFLSFYPVGQSASKSRVFRIKRDTELYIAFEKYFNWAWRITPEYQPRQI